MKKLGIAAQWMKDHPEDTPCPSDPRLALSWRRKRGLAPLSEKDQEQIRKYEAAMGRSAQDSILTEDGRRKAPRLLDDD
jgi:hypothetical protein